MMIARLATFASIVCAALTGALMFGRAQAAELVMFEQRGCPWCAAFDREIAPIYPKTPEGARAPLRRVDIAKPLPRDLAFVTVERMTPVFVLVDDGREIGRIRGYPGEDHFWGLLGELMARLDRPNARSIPMEWNALWILLVGACSCRRTGSHFAGTSASEPAH